MPSFVVKESLNSVKVFWLEQEKLLAQLRNLAVGIGKRDGNILKIILFGSYAYGEPSPDSDLDLFIIKQTDKERRERFVEVKRLVYDPKRKVAVSPLVYTPKEVKDRLSLGDDFVNEILEKGVVLYAR